VEVLKFTSLSVPQSLRVLRRTDRIGWNVAYWHNSDLLEPLLLAALERKADLQILPPMISHCPHPGTQHPTLLNSFLSKVSVPIVPVALANWRTATLCAAVHSASFLASHHRRLARVPAPRPRSTPGNLAQRQGLARPSLHGLVCQLPLLPHPRAGW
jgi:hypothetical protein